MKFRHPLIIAALFAAFLFAGAGSSVWQDEEKAETGPLKYECPVYGFSQGGQPLHGEPEIPSTVTVNAGNPCGKDYQRKDSKNNFKYYPHSGPEARNNTRARGGINGKTLLFITSAHGGGNELLHSTGRLNI